MPFVRISLNRGRSPEFIRALADATHRALVEAFDVPANDRFQVIHQHEAGELIFDRRYFIDGERSDGFVLIHVQAGRPRSEAAKRATYRRLVELLAESPGIRPEDVMITISTSQPEDWSFGNGIAQMLDKPIPGRSHVA